MGVCQSTWLAVMLATWLLVEKIRVLIEFSETCTNKNVDPLARVAWHLNSASYLHSTQTREDRYWEQFTENESKIINGF